MTLLKGGRRVDWAGAQAAVDRLGRILRDVGFTAPENTHAQQEHLIAAARTMGVLSDALCLGRGDVDRLTLVGLQRMRDTALVSGLLDEADGEAIGRAVGWLAIMHEKIGAAS